MLVREAGLFCDIEAPISVREAHSASISIRIRVCIIAYQISSKKSTPNFDINSSGVFNSHFFHSRTPRISSQFQGRQPSETSYDSYLIRPSSPAYDFNIAAVKHSLKISPPNTIPRPTLIKHNHLLPLGIQQEKEEKNNNNNEMTCRFCDPSTMSKPFSPKYCMQRDIPLLIPVPWPWAPNIRKKKSDRQGSKKHRTCTENIKGQS